MSDTTYDWRLLRAGRLLLDAGGMFGLIPRVVWERGATPDAKHRLELSHNGLLLENGGRLIVIETGTGDKLDAKMASIFGLDGRTIETALREVECDPGDVSDVIITHLHFDHAGGLTRRPRAGETPDWTGPASGDAEGIKLTFANAHVHVQRREWEDALANRSLMTKTYYRDHLDPIAERVRLAECPAPFAPGTVVDRNAHPPAPLAEREREILPGVFVFCAPGHTWGHQAVRFTDRQGRTVVFPGDLIPSRHHVGSAYSLAYDVEPYTTCVSKGWFLAEAAARGWLLVLDHEPGHPLCTVAEDGRGWYALEPAE